MKIVTAQDFWNQIKKVYQVKSSKVNLPKTIAVNGEQCSNKEIIANAFCEYFTNIGNKLKSSLTFLVDSTWGHYDCFELRKKINPAHFSFGLEKVSERTVPRILKKLKRNTSLGYDYIPTSLIVDGAEELARPLSYLLNNLLEKSIFPDAEKVAKISPIYNSGEKMLHRKLYTQLCSTFFLQSN